MSPQLRAQFHEEQANRLLQQEPLVREFWLHFNMNQKYKAEASVPSPSPAPAADGDDQSAES